MGKRPYAPGAGRRGTLASAPAQAGSGEEAERTLGSPRQVSVWAQRLGIGIVVAIVATFALRVGTSSSQSVNMRDPSIWLASAATGDVVLAHAGSGSRGEVVARVRVANPGESIVVAQGRSGAVVLNRTKREVGEIDAVTQTLSQRAPLDGVDEATQLLWSPAGARVVTSGAVYRLDPETGVPLGTTELSTALAGAVVDAAGNVYGTSESGQIIAVTNAAAPVSLPAAAEPVALVVAGGQAYVVDRNGVDRNGPVLQALDGAGIAGRSCLSGTIGATAVRTGGSAPGSARPLAVVVDPTGGLRIAEPGRGQCTSVALAVAPGTDFGAPVVAGDLVYVPVRTTGQVIVVSAADSAEVRRFDLGLGAGTAFELLEHDGTVWFNDPTGRAAGVIGRDGIVARIDKTAAVAASGAAGAGTSGSRSSGGTGTGATGAGGGARTSGASGTPISGPTGASGSSGGNGTASPTGPRSTLPGSATGSAPDASAGPSSGPSTPGSRVGLVADFTYSSRSVKVGQSVSFVDASSGEPTAWTWEFGDGTFATGPKTSHTWTQAGTFTVTLRVENATASATASVAITVVADAAKAKPDADFRFNTSRVEAGQPVTFTDRSTGEPSEWQWSFGDGSGGAGPTITHVYRTAGTYEVTLTVSNDQGSATSSPALITVFDKVEPPIAAIGGGQATAGVGQVVGWFNRSSGNVTTLQWTFGDGTSASGPVVQHAWTRPGSYTVTLVVSNSAGSNSATAAITINEVASPPVSRFTVSQTNAEEGQALRFQSLSINNPTQLSWDFGDGSTASGSAVTHAFARAGTYIVGLRATNAAGSDLATQQISVVAQLPAPVAAFSFSPATITMSIPVVFTDESSGGTPTAWSWDFGDGTAVVAQRNPTHLFERVGSYVVRLSATNARGSSVAQRTVTVLPAAPEAAFTYTPIAPLAGARVDFVDTSTGGAPTAWLWNFGDGGTSTLRNPSHTFSDNGTYDVRLTVTNATGPSFVVRRVEVSPPAPQASFTYTPTAPTTATPVAFRNTSTGGAASTIVWDFGDGTPTSTTPNPSHTYTAAGAYTVRLTAGNITGTSNATVRIVVTVPAASFTVSSPVLVGAAATFTNTSTGGPFSAVAWDFGDSSPVSTSTNATHAFAAAGSYNVRLTVTNGGGSASTTVLVTVVTPIVADFTVSTPRIALQAITFTNITAGGPFTSLDWDFGDGATATGATVGHTYAAGGSFNVRLRAVATTGATDEHTVAITVAPPVPVAAFSAAIEPSVLRTLTFDSAGSVGGPFTSITWDFGHAAPNNTATGAVVTHTFPAGTSFVVRLTLTNVTGTGTTTRTISIVNPVAAFSVTTPATPAYTRVFDSAPSTGGPFVTISWDFGDSTTGTGAAPTHTYAAAGTYPVTLTVTNAAGSASVTTSVTIT